MEPKNLVRIGFLWREKERFFSLEWDLGSLSIGTNFAIRAPFSGAGHYLPQIMGIFETRAQSDRSGSLGRKALVIVEGREAKKGDSWWLM